MLCVSNGACSGSGKEKARWGFADKDIKRADYIIDRWRTPSQYSGRKEEPENSLFWLSPHFDFQVLHIRRKCYLRNWHHSPSLETVCPADSPETLWILALTRPLVGETRINYPASQPLPSVYRHILGTRYIAVFSSLPLSRPKLTP